MIVVDFYRVYNENGGYTEYANISDIPQGSVYQVFSREVQTPEEIAAEEAIIQEENEDKFEYSTILEAGKELFMKHQMRLLRRVKKGALTKVRAATVRTLLTDTYVLLNLGFWDLANTKVLAIPVQTNAGIQNEIDWIKEKIAEYLPTTNLRIG